MKIEICYTYPPDEAARQAERDLEAIETAAARLPSLSAAAEKAEDRETLEKEIQTLQEEIARRPEVLEAAQARAQLRIVVRARAYLDRSHYAELFRAGREWAQAQAGAESTGEELTLEQVDLLNLAYFRATMLASVERERRNGETIYKAERRESQADDWQPAQIPPEWITPEGMGRDMPAALFEAWRDAAEELNPTGNFPIASRRID